MTTALLYARFSTDLQSQTSAEDQLRLCRQRALREGWVIGGEFTDLAISGSVRNRPGLNAMLAALEAQQGSVVIAEALDRISRDQEDVAGLFKRFRFNGVRLITLSEGEIGALHIGMTGTMSALFLEQLGAKTRRGQIGRVAAGRIPGGLSYGYRMVRDLRDDGSFEGGVRTIDPDQAEVIRRIFADFIAGIGPKTIAKSLNAAGITSPRGGLWRANALTGNRARGNGLLNNELYRGRIIYNRQRFLRDPDTRKRVSRLNPESEWVISEAPELRIIDDQVWAAAQARLGAVDPKRPWTARRPKRLFSGLIRCGSCGGTMTILCGDRISCTNVNQTGTCTMTRTISAAALESRVLDAMRSEWLHPDSVAAYVEEFAKTATEIRRGRIKQGAALDRRMAELDAELDGIVDAICAGVAVDRLKARAQACEAEQAQLAARKTAMATEATALDDLILHPRIADMWRTRVENLREAFYGPEAERPKARQIIRNMIDAIVCTPREQAPGLDLTVQGQLAAILQTAKGRTPKGNGLTVEVVAGVGFEPTTFRL